MAKKETVQAVKETVQAPKEAMKYILTFSDGTVIEGSTTLREFKPNTEKSFHNSGYQVKVADGNFSGNIMIIDYSKQKTLARK